MTLNPYNETMPLQCSYSSNPTMATNVQGSIIVQSGTCSKSPSYNNAGPSSTVSDACGLANANASSSAQPILVGSNLSGKLTRSGSCSLPFPLKGRVKAHSSAKVTLTFSSLTQSLIIEMALNLAEMIRLAGNISFTSSFIATDESNEEILARGTLLDIQTSYKGDIEANNKTFTINVNRELAKETGILLLEYEKDVITRVEDAGIFAGVSSSLLGCSADTLEIDSDTKLNLSFTLPVFATAYACTNPIILTGAPIEIVRV